MDTPFIGRKAELEKLNLLFKKKSASLVVIKGRRRIGKSRLVEEFGKSFKFYSFSGVPPTEKTTHLDQLREFGWQLGKALKQPTFQDRDWNDLFLRLAAHTRRGATVILLDEISWMGSKDPHFLGKLKNAWDSEFKKNSKLILILCGSVSSWIEENIIKNTGFLGRISLDLTLEELPLTDCNQFFWKSGSEISAYEKFKILSVTGGVPRYLEEIHIHLPAETNIKNLCFDRSGFLFDEFDKIFTDIFSNKSETYKRIIESLKEGKYEYEDIYRNLGIEKSGFITEYLENLEKSGFIQRDFTWHLKDGKTSKLSKYRISDNYLRFYLNYILPNKEKIIKNSFSEKSLANFPGWSGIMGMQFENLVLNNRRLVQKQLKLEPGDIVFDNPYFQNKTTRQGSCQIDYLVQTQFDSLFVCEIKFSKNPISRDIIPEVQEKLKRLKVPRYMSRRPILLHVNGVKEDVIEAGYFSEIIDFGKLLERS